MKKKSDKKVIAVLLNALEDVLEVLEQGDDYQGEVLEVEATVREALELGTKCLEEGV